MIGATILLLQKKAMKILYHAHYTLFSSPHLQTARPCIYLFMGLIVYGLSLQTLFKELNILIVVNILIVYGECCFLNIMENIEKYLVNQYETRFRKKLVGAKVRTDKRSKSLSFIGIRFFNQLPIGIRILLQKLC
jgi:hypothetical protein